MIRGIGAGSAEVRVPPVLAKMAGDVFAGVSSVVLLSPVAVHPTEALAVSEASS